MSLATEVLAATLIRSGEYPALSNKEIAEARQRLARAFQEAWIKESVRLNEAGKSCA